MDLTKYDLSDYDKLFDEKIDTKLFTDLTDVEIINLTNGFVIFLNGFSDYLIEEEILHGWYHIPTKTAKFLVKSNARKFRNMILLAWQRYWEDESSNIHIYTQFRGSLYKDF